MVFVLGPIADVVGANGGEASALGFSEDAFSKRGGGDLREKGKNIDQHDGRSGLGGAIGE